MKNSNRSKPEEDISQKQVNVSIESLKTRLCFYFHSVFISRMVLDELSNGKEADRLFVLNLIYYVSSGEVEYDDFVKIAEEDLEKICKALLKKDKCLAEEFSDTGNLYKDFRRAIIDIASLENNEDLVQGLVVAQSEVLRFIEVANIPQVAKQIENDRVLTLIKESANGSKLQEILKIEINLPDVTREEAKLYKGIGASLSDFNENIKEALPVWGTVCKQSAKTREHYTKVKPNALQILKKNKWPISPNVTACIFRRISQLENSNREQEKVVDDIFIERFERNDWRLLGQWLTKWRKIPRLENRLPALQNCINALKSNNVDEELVSRLIDQVEGLICDYLESQYILHKGNFGGNEDKLNALKNNLNVKNSALIFKDVAPTILFDVLFSPYTKKDWVGIYDYKKLKLLPGKDLNYGKKKSLVKAFILIDFVASLD